MCSFAEAKQPLRKKRKICYDFLASIDQTGNVGNCNSIIPYAKPFTDFKYINLVIYPLWL